MISPFNGHDFSDFITETDFVPANIRAHEISSIRRAGEVFVFIWRRHQKVFACRVVEPKKGFDILMSLKEEIKARPDSEERVEDWECINEHGVFDFTIYCALLKSRNND
jgi:hypothetical protein